jgi:hypothetical protein
VEVGGDAGVEVAACSCPDGVDGAVRGGCGERGVEILFRVLVVALCLVGEAAVDMGRYQDAARRRHDVDRRVGLREPDRLGAVGDGAIKVTLGAPDHGAIGQGGGKGGIEPDRFVDVGERAIEIAERLLRGAAVLIRICFLRRQPDRLIVVRNRAGIISPGAPGVAAVVKDDAAGRAHPQRVAEV